MNDRELTSEIAAAASQNTVEKAYWTRRLRGEPIRTTFPHDRRNRATASPGKPNKKNVFLVFPPGLNRHLLTLCKNYDYSLHMILLAVLAVTVERYTGNRDIILGTPIYRQESEGRYINTALPLRVILQEGMTFKDLMLQVRQTVLEAVKNQNYPVETLLYKWGIPLSGPGYHFFHMALLLENIHDVSYIRHLHLDMIFSINRINEDIEGNILYDAFLYKQATVKRIAVHFAHLLRQFVFDIQAVVDRVEMLPGAEKQELLYKFNNIRDLKDLQCPASSMLHQLFEEQVLRLPDTIALGFMDSQLSYRELNRWANQVALTLREKGIREDTLAALLVERSLEMIAGMLGILKAGGAYLPIDPQYPRERVDYMLSDSGVRLLVTTGNLVKEGEKVRRWEKEKNLEILFLNNLSSSALQNPDLPGLLTSQPHNLRLFAEACQVGTANLAYVIYTSGSTGKPKGVAVEHASIVNTLCWRRKCYGFEPGYVMLQVPSFAFDSSVNDIFGPLTGGCRLILAEQRYLSDMDSLGGLLERFQVTYLILVPILLKTLLEEIPGSLKSVKAINVAGDNFTSELVRKHFQTAGHIKLYNEYGPTENSVSSTIYLFPKGKAEVLIGKPIDNAFCCIVNRQGQMSPVGVAGEIWLGGHGLSRGYLNRPQLNQDKFVKSLFFPGTRMYRSGDLARLRSDKNLEFLGRIDRQVKIRGFRIEPEEIENSLNSHEKIKEAAVVVKENEAGEKHLCVYYVPLLLAGGEEIDKAELQQYLSRTFPSYMVPSYYVPLDRIPLTVHGKINRDLLSTYRVQQQTVFVAPRSQVEKKIARIWAEVLDLQVESIGIDNDFFQLGGHSLKVTVLISRLLKTFNLKIPFATVFQLPTIREQARYMEKTQKSNNGAPSDSYNTIEPVEEKKYYPVPPMVRRTYLSIRQQPDLTIYNRPIIMKVKGPLDIDRLEVAFNKLIREHEILRTSFHWYPHPNPPGGTVIQKIHRRVTFELERYTALETDAEMIIQQFIKPFHLDCPPLVRAGIIEERGGGYLFMVDFHRILSDGVTMGIFWEELTAHYQSGKLQRPPQQYQYKEYTEWLHKQIASGRLSHQEAYWISRFKDEHPAMQMPGDFPVPGQWSYEGERIIFPTGKELSAGLKKLARDTETTLFMVLIAAYSILLYKYTGQPVIIIGTPIAGRRYEEFQRVMGLFVNFLPMKNYPGGKKTFGKFLEEVKENALNAFENQDYPFDILVEKLDIKAVTRGRPLLEFVFSMENMAPPSVHIRELTFEPFRFDQEIIHFNLFLLAWEVDNDIRLQLSYVKALYRSSTAKGLLENYRQILESIVKNKEILIDRIPVQI